MVNCRSRNFPKELNELEAYRLTFFCVKKGRRSNRMKKIQLLPNCKVQSKRFLGSLLSVLPIIAIVILEIENVIL